jgi:hypothetical protein
MSLQRREFLSLVASTSAIVMSPSPAAAPADLHAVMAAIGLRRWISSSATPPC